MGRVSYIKYLVALECVFAKETSNYNLLPHITHEKKRCHVGRGQRSARRDSCAPILT